MQLVKFSKGLITGVLIVVAGVALQFGANNTEAQLTGKQAQSAEDHSHHMMPAASSKLPALQSIVVDFDLVTANDRPVSIEDFSGHFLLLGFGFTHCEYVCPTMSANIARVINTADRAVLGALISVDTERDTPSITHAYAQGFHKDLMGLSGNHSQVADAAKNFGVSFVVTKTQKSFTVQHSASLFLIDPKGELLDVFALNASTADIIETMQEWEST